MAVIKNSPEKVPLATGHILRLGYKVAVTRTELINNEGVLIAVSASTYIVGQKKRQGA